MSDGAPVRWEYTVVTFAMNVWGTKGDWDKPELSGFSSEQVLNHYGAQGWEFFGFGPIKPGGSSSQSVAYIFKRPLP